MKILKTFVDELPYTCEKCILCYEYSDTEYDDSDYEMCLLKVWDNRQGAGDYESHIWDVKEDKMTSWRTVNDDDLNDYRNADDFPYKDKRHEQCPLIVMEII